MKIFSKFICIILLAVIASCKNDTPFLMTDHYSSANDFFLKNNVSMQTYTINGSSGGSFTSPQGTIVTIPPNAFLFLSNKPVTGDVTVQFKDIYKKSDMLLANLPTTTFDFPLKSGGEFFIKAIANNSAVILAAGKKINVEQPAVLTGGLDTVNIQSPFIQLQDSSGANQWATQTLGDTVIYLEDAYFFSLYQFTSPVDSGSWCNSDNSSYFSNYNMTNLALHPNDGVNNYGTQVFLIFNEISCMVHVYYESYSFNFPYYYAPIGLHCTLVAIGVKDGTLYSSFVPIIITSNQTINFSLNKTTTDKFIAQLRLLDQ